MSASSNAPAPSPPSSTATMLRVKPLAALRPPPDRASRVASVPYDVVSSSEARQLAAGNPDSFLHVVRPEIDLPEDISLYDDRVYAQAAASFRSMQERGVLVREDAEHFYLYRLECELLGRRVSQTGLVCCCHIDDYASGVIKKHEKTRQDKEDDRTRHVLELSANAEPVFFLHHDDDAISKISADLTSGAPLVDFTAPDGVRHMLWRADESASGPITEAFARLACAFVADGHHRTASAARAGAERRAANPNHTGEEEYNWFLSVLFPASQLSILPYHRVVKDLGGLKPQELVERLAAIAEIAPTNNPDPPGPGSVCMYLPGLDDSPSGWHRITFDPQSIDRSDPIASLDYVLLADRILHPILGIKDIRTDKRIDFVGGIRGTDELAKRVDSGDMALAFSLHPVTIDQLVAVADANQIMPPKSTWFEPKLRSGLVVHTLD